MNSFIKKGKAKSCDEYFFGKNLEEGILSNYKYTYSDLKKKFNEIGKNINNSTFSHWIEDLELRKRGLAIKKANGKIKWYLNEEGFNELYEHGKTKKIGYKVKLRVTDNDTYKCEVKANLVKSLNIKRYDDLCKLINSLIEFYYQQQLQKINEEKVKLIQQEIRQKQLELEDLESEMMAYQQSNINR